MRPRARIIAAIAFAAALLTLACGAAAQTGVMWTGSGGGLWSDAENWNPEVVPNNSPPDTYYNVTVNKPGPVVDGGFSIAGLTITDLILLTEGSNLGFQSESGSTAVNGSGEISIQIPAPFAPTSIVIATHLGLAGGGRITMLGAGTARIVGGPSTSLTNESWTISGEGHLLEGFGALTNRSTISASSGTLLVRAEGCTNTGTMRAIPSGTLHIQGNSGSMNNAGGTVLASGGLVQFSGNLHVTGGTLRSESAGSFEAISSGGGTHRLRALENDANFFVTGSTVEIQDIISNLGTFHVNGGSMRAVGAATLDGGGQVRLNSGSLFTGVGTMSTLTLENGTIRGTGAQMIGSIRTITVGTLGKIQAIGGNFFVGPGAGGLVNNGMLVADSGTLVLSGASSLENSNGRIRAEASSNVVFSSDIRVNGGTLETVGNGSLSVGASTSAQFTAPTIDGQMILEPGSTAVCTGLFQGNFNIDLRPGSKIEVEGQAQFGPTGRIFPDGAVIKAREPQLADGPGAYLFINDGLIEGDGTIGTNDLQITNNGTIAANAEQITINPAADGLVNNGVIEARGSGSISLDGTGGGSFTQEGAGKIRAADATSNVRLVNNTTLSGGMLAAGAGSIVLTGTTTLANVTSQARVVQVGAGSLLINGTVTNSGSITTGTTGRLIVGGSLTIGGGGSFSQGGMGPGHLLSNGSLIVNTSGHVDAHLIEGVGTTTVQTGGTLSAHSIRQNRLSINDGASAELKSAAPGTADPSRVGSLTIGAAPAVLDVANRVLILDQSGPAQLSSLRTHIADGYNGGTWDGPGVRSSTAAATPAHGVGFGEASAIYTSFPATYFGQTVDNSTLLVTYTRYGDANLDRVVSLDDFNRLAANFGLTNRTWTQADFTYDTLCNLVDFNALAANFGLAASPSGPTPQDWAALASVVPEPSAIVLLAGAGVLRRRLNA